MNAQRVRLVPSYWMWCMFAQVAIDLTGRVPWWWLRVPLAMVSVLLILLVIGSGWAAWKARRFGVVGSVVVSSTQDASR